MEPPENECVNNPLMDKEKNKDTLQVFNSENMDQGTDKSASRFYLLSRLGCICFIGHACYATFYAIENLQSSINPQSGLGSLSIGMMSFIIAIGCGFASALLKIISPKPSLAIGSVGIIAYVLFNLHATYITLMLGSLCLGIPSGVHAVALNYIVIYLGKKYSALTGKSSDTVIQLFFAYFQASYALSKPSGLFITSVILRKVIYNKYQPENRTFVGSNNTNMDETVHNSICGVNHCPYLEEHTSVLLLPNQGQLYAIIISLAAICFLGLLLIYFLPSVSYTPDNKLHEEILRIVKLHSNFGVLFLLPSFFTLGAVEAMLASTFYSSFVSCNLGLAFVSPIVICEGLSCTVFAFLCGYSSRYIDCHWHLIVSYLSNIIVITLCLFFNPSVTWALFCLPAIQGATIGMVKSTIFPYVSRAFPGKEAVITSLLYVYQYSAKAIVFVYAPFLCFKPKAYLLITFCLTSILTIIIQKFIVRKKNIKTELTTEVIKEQVPTE